MSGSSPRSGVAFLLVLCLGLLPLANAQAASAERGARAAQQQSQGSTWIGALWSWMTELWAKTQGGPPNGRGPGWNPNNPGLDNGTGIDPHGTPGPPGPRP
jgi:hypothetical protein